MDRYQKLSDKLREQLPNDSKFRKSPVGQLLGKWQSKVDSSIDRFVKREFDRAELLLVPQDLHTSDPSLMGEIMSGQFGLDGMFVEIGEGKPSLFEAPFSDDSFVRVLLGFGWLRDLRARADIESQREAQRLVLEWINDYSDKEGINIEPEVLACRITSFLSNSSFLMKGLSKKNSWRFMQNLSRQIAMLDFLLDKTPGGLPRLGVLATLVMAGLCLSLHNELLQKVTPLFLRELEEQVLADGGHSSRNPAALPHLLFQLLPLRQCYKGRQQDVPAELDKAISGMLPMIRFFRLGDSSLARFNGTSTTPTDALATLLAYDERNRPFDAYAKQSGYCRVQDGPTTILCDVGSPPLGPSAKLTHAGCLSFEMSVRHFAVVVNAGAFQGGDERWQRFARTTMAHSTLTLDDYSSGGFDKKGRLSGPHDLDVQRADLSGLSVVHHGYEKKFGFLHKRSMVLSHEGLSLNGVDSLEAVGLASEVPFAIRFHLHPLVELARSNEDNLLITLPDGEIWRFTAKGASIEMHDSIYLAYRRGPQPTHQIILAGAARAGTKVSWTFEQYRSRPDVS